MLVYCAAVVQLNLNFPALYWHSSNHRIVKTSCVHPNSPQEYWKSGRWTLLPPPPLCGIRWWSCRRWKPHFSPQSCSTAWGKPLRVCSHSDHLLSHNVASKLKIITCPTETTAEGLCCVNPVTLFGTLPLFLGLFPATSGLLVHSDKKKQREGGGGRTARTRNQRSARRQEHRGGLFCRKGLLWEEEEKRRDNPVRRSGFSSSEVTATVDVIEADGYIMLFY